MSTAQAIRARGQATLIVIIFICTVIVFTVMGGMVQATPAQAEDKNQSPQSQTNQSHNADDAPGQQKKQSFQSESNEGQTLGVGVDSPGWLQRCENSKQTITNKLRAFTTAGSTQLDRLIATHQSISEAKGSTRIYVDQMAWDELKANTITEQKSAQDALQELRDLAQRQIDCSDESVLETLTDIKTSAHQVKDSLQSYRESLVRKNMYLSNIQD